MLVAVAGVGIFLSGFFRLDCRHIDRGCDPDSSWHAVAQKRYWGHHSDRARASPFRPRTRAQVRPGMARPLDPDTRVRGWHDCGCRCGRRHRRRRCIVGFARRRRSTSERDQLRPKDSENVECVRPVILDGGGGALRKRPKPDGISSWPPQLTRRVKRLPPGRGATLGLRSRALVLKNPGPGRGLAEARLRRMGYALARVFGGMILATPADGVSASDHVLAP
jgi:hypothetical protein